MGSKSKEQMFLEKKSYQSQKDKENSQLLKQMQLNLARRRLAKLHKANNDDQQFVLHEQSEKQHASQTARLYKNTANDDIVYYDIESFMVTHDQKLADKKGLDIVDKSLAKKLTLMGLVRHPANAYDGPFNTTLEFDCDVNVQHINTKLSISASDEETVQSYSDQMGAAARKGCNELKDKVKTDRMVVFSLLGGGLALTLMMLLLKCKSQKNKKFSSRVKNRFSSDTSEELLKDDIELQRKARSSTMSQPNSGSAIPSCVTNNSAQFAYAQEEASLDSHNPMSIADPR